MQLSHLVTIVVKRKKDVEILSQVQLDVNACFLVMTLIWGFFLQKENIANAHQLIKE